MSADEDAFWRTRELNGVAEQLARYDERIKFLKENKLGPEHLTIMRDFANAGDERTYRDAASFAERSVTNLQTNMRNEYTNALQSSENRITTEISGVRSEIADAVNKMADVVGTALDARFPEERHGFLSHPMTKYGGSSAIFVSALWIIAQILGMRIPIPQ